MFYRSIIEFGVHFNLYITRLEPNRRVNFMRRVSAEELQTSKLVEQLRQRISLVGRWHIKRRKADSTRIWKRLFKDLEDLLKEQHPFTKTSYISIIVYMKENKYLTQVHKHNCSSFHGYIATRQKDYTIVIAELNSVLKQYNLELAETPESKKRDLSHTINGYKEYDVKFVQTTE